MLLLIIFASQPIGNSVLVPLNEVYYRCRRRFSSILQHSLKGHLELEWSAASFLFAHEIDLHMLFIIL